MQLISRKTLLLFFLPGAVFMGAFFDLSDYNHDYGQLL